MQGPLDIYKNLPRTNCGRCPQKTCMAYAAAFLRGEAKVDDCPILTDEARHELSKVTPTDWRLKLIEQLKEEIAGIDLQEIASGIGAEVVDNAIRIRCLGMDYLIDNRGEIRTEGHINPWIKILLLHYVRTAGRARPAGQWVSFSELKSGMVKAKSFSRDCEEPLKELFQRDESSVEAALVRMGARRIDFETADLAYRFHPLPAIPTLILYRRQEGSLKVLFDRVTDRYLDVESIVFLFEGLVHLLTNILSGHRR